MRGFGGGSDVSCFALRCVHNVRRSIFVGLQRDVGFLHIVYRVGVSRHHLDACTAQCSGSRTLAKWAAKPGAWDSSQDPIIPRPRRRPSYVLSSHMCMHQTHQRHSTAPKNQPIVQTGPRGSSARLPPGAGSCLREIASQQARGNQRKPLARDIGSWQLN